MSEHQQTKRKRIRTRVGKITRTKQAQAAECDINAIMRRHLAGGGISHLNTREAFYGDFANIEDYQGSMQRIRAAQERFDALPARVRDHCRNDPAELVKMALDPDRVGEMIELGLLPKPKEEKKPEVKTPPSKPPEERPKGESPVQGGD